MARHLAKLVLAILAGAASVGAARAVAESAVSPQKIVEMMIETPLSNAPATWRDALPQKLADFGYDPEPDQENIFGHRNDSMLQLRFGVGTKGAAFQMALPKAYLTEMNTFETLLDSRLGEISSGLAVERYDNNPQDMGWYWKDSQVWHAVYLFQDDDDLLLEYETQENE